MLSKKDIIGINKELSNGHLINEGSLDYVTKEYARSKNWLKTAAGFTRAILIDHVFEDGNKRTAAAVIMLLMKMNKINFEPEEIPNIIVEILKKNITNIRGIEKCIKNGIR